jgi:eukaryotic-like serine/threonine-protein kinase
MTDATPGNSDRSVPPDTESRGMPWIDPESWPRVEEILDGALELEGEARRAYIDAACVGDERLRAAVESLLEADAHATGGSLDRGADDLLGRPERIGPYRVLRELGRGGMGAVYLAERVDGQFEQTVALKLVKRGMDTDEVLRRFVAERQILARLEHPNIARLLDGGVTPDGRPFFAMEYVDGALITAYCEQQNLSLDRRIDLFEETCSAVAYAQRNLVVHRDLKPSNVLVDESGRVKLLDFGIAKLLTRDNAAGSATLTGRGITPMTPMYAAPEQVRADPVTTATDVYSLGVLLYELAAGQRPYRLADTSDFSIQRAILESDPEPLPRRVPRDLAAVIYKALRKLPGDRYASADALLEDVRRFRAALPVNAQRPSRLYRARKFVARHKAGVVSAALIVVALVGGVVATSHQARVARREAAAASAVKDFLVSIFEASDPEQSKGQTISARELLDKGAERVTRELSGQPEVQADLSSAIGRIYLGLGDFDKAEDLARTALAIRRREHSQDDERVAESLIDLGNALYFRAAHDSSRAAYEEALRILGAHEGSSDPRTALPHLHLGWVDYVTDDLESAERHFREALRFETEKPASTSSTRAAALMPRVILESLNGLAIVVEERGQPAEAESLYQRALAYQERAFPEALGERAKILNNLALRRVDQDRYAEAESLMHDAIAAQRKLFGGDHPDVAMTYISLTRVLASAGKLAEAESASTHALALTRQFFGDDNPRTATAASDRAIIHVQRGEYSAARALLRDTDRVYTASLGPDHTATLAMRTRLAVAERECGNLEASRTQLEGVLASLTQLPEDKRDAAAVAQNKTELAFTALRGGKPAEAESLAGDALASLENLEGAPALDIAFASLIYGHAFAAQDRRAEADSAYKRSLSIVESTLPDGHPSLAIYTLRYGTFLARTGHALEGLPLLERAFEIRRRSLGSNWRTAEAEGALGLCLVDLGRHSDGKAHLQNALPRLRAAEGQPDPTAREVESALRIGAPRASR